jgi:hypothetical protein
MIPEDQSGFDETPLWPRGRGLHVTPHEVTPESARPVGGGDIPPPAPPHHPFTEHDTASHATRATA